jgi:hypothetical protein
VAKETRKLQRAAGRPAEQLSGKQRKAALKQAPSVAAATGREPLGREQLKSMALRLGIPVLGAWMICGLVAGVTYSSTTRIVMLAIPAVVTLLAGGLAVYILRQARRARGVASILGKADSAEGRQAALAELETSFKKKDPAAIFARAQLELQEDPARALSTLEQIDLNKVMAPIADEARAQRALIHLTQGQVSQARQLVDGIDLKRHQEARSRAMMAAVVAEAWARSGQPKKGLETLNLFNPEDDEYEELRPQLYRAYAYAYAYTSDLKGVRRVLRRLLEQDVRLLGGFMMKRTHPLLQKEARKLIDQSGQVPRKMQIQRRP